MSETNAPEACEWHQVEEDYDSYTACGGHCFEFNVGTPQENHFTYCPYCAKPIRTVMADISDDGEDEA